MKTILITGAGGYIGSVATSLLLAKGYEVVALDNFSTGYRVPLDMLKEKYKDQLRIYEADLAGDLSPLFEKEKHIKAALHFAAKCSVNESMQHPEWYFSNNTGATTNFLNYLIKYHIKNIVFSSTCAVYGEAQYMPIDEQHPTVPTNPYGASKLMSEQIIRWYGRLHDLHYVILRYFNVCGATDHTRPHPTPSSHRPDAPDADVATDGMLIGDSKHPSVHLMQNAVRGALGIEPFQLTCGTFDTPDGTPIRDYVNVVDLNEAHILALAYLINGGKSDIINLGTGSGNSVMEIVKKVQKITGKHIQVGRAAARSGEYARMVASIDKAQQILKWKPTHTLEDSVRSLVAWYTKHPNGWE